MALLADEAMRLVRVKWANANELAEEVFEILRAQVPVQFDQPLVIDNPTSGPAIAFKNSIKPGDVLYTFNLGGEEIPVTYSDFLGLDSNGKPIAVDQSTTAGGGIPARIVSGSGDTYVIDLFEKGKPAGVTKTVTATQLQIAAGETIPPGTWTLASKAGSSYSIQVPVWL